MSPPENGKPERGDRAMECKLLQVVFAIAGLVLVGFSLAGELIVAPLLWLWQRRVAQAAQHSALT
jgi:hypothetical protein